jgi:hypothetical protein
MPNITVVTPPDKVYNFNKSILLIYPDDAIKDQLQTLVQDIEGDFNLYLYSLEDTEQNSEWLLDLIKLCDTVIFNIDKSSPEVRQLASYIIAHTNVFWLTNAAETVYTKLSNNRVYDLSFLNKGDFCESQKQ